MTLSAARPVIPASRYAERLERARTHLAEQGDTALLIGVGPELRYLIGYDAAPLERLTMLVLAASGRAILVAPRLESMAAAGSPASTGGLVEVVSWTETEDAHAIVAAHTPQARVLVSGSLSAMHVLALQRALPGRSFGLSRDVLRDLRMIKDADEIALLRLAAHAADRVIAAIIHGPLVGRTEADVSREIRQRLVDEGHEAAAFAIVGSGPNAASPHHEAGDRIIRRGEPIVLDIGGSLGGYGSDTTRTVWIRGNRGEGPDADFERIYELVRRAHSAAVAAVWPGVSCAGLDALARGLIADGGHARDFLHRLGHGIGVESHEDPYLVEGSPDVLRPGMAFSIEPGVYVGGRHGARIEDVVVCAADGPDVLNENQRELLVVDG